MKSFAPQAAAEPSRPARAPRRLPMSTLAIERVIALAAAPQLGLVTSAQLLAAGVLRDPIARRVREGTLVQLYGGVFRCASAEPTDAQRWLAACLAVGNGVVARRTAARVHGLPVGFSDRRVPIEVLVPGARRVNLPGVRLWRSVRGQPSRPWYSARVTTVEATIIDLGGLVKMQVLGRCIDQALADRLTTIGRIRVELERRTTNRLTARQTFAALLDERSDGRLRHRSGTESSVGDWLRAGGLHGWVPNLVVDVGDGREFEVDFAWRRAKIGLEVSPFYTHGSAEQQAVDAERRRLLALAGWCVVEATDPHLVNAAAFAPIVASIRAHLHQRTAAAW